AASFSRMFVQICLYFYCKCLWRCLKFMVRKLTGRCELQRICYNTKPGAARTMKIGNCKIFSSACLFTFLHGRLNSAAYAVKFVVLKESISFTICLQCNLCIGTCLQQVFCFCEFSCQVEICPRVSFCFQPTLGKNRPLWKCLKPNSPLKARISKQWCEIGFQGDDPKTDFRGMGLLGLYNLVYFAEWDTEIAQQVLSDSLQPKYSVSYSVLKDYKLFTNVAASFSYSYSFAIVGINITDLAYNLLVSGALKTHFYNVAPEAPTLTHFQQTFCYLMHEFHKFWIEEDPLDIMEFNRVREKFHKRILKQLQNPEMALCPHFAASESLVNM
ncbi:ELMO domain-containing protein 1, partial [Eudyptula minor]